MTLHDTFCILQDTYTFYYRENGVSTQILDKEKLISLYPWLDSSDIIAGSICKVFIIDPIVFYSPQLFQFLCLLFLH